MAAAPVPTPAPTATAVVYGLGVTGRAMARALVAHGVRVVPGDDRDHPEARALAAELGTDLRVGFGPGGPAALLAGADLLVPAPGMAEHHPLVVAALAAGVSVRSELDLAQGWEDGRARPRPFVAITGTDGKTTVTTMVTAMARAAGWAAEAVGNTEVPLVAALDGPAELFVVEASSFRLRFTERFRPRVATWLNLADDHLDWHRTRQAYAEAKARVWQVQEAHDVAIGPTDDPIVRAALAAAPGRRRTFGPGGDYQVVDAVLTGPSGPIVAVAELPRALPHDVANALAAAATALEFGLPVEAVRDALVAYRHLPHRVAFVAEHHGVRWYDDSKATAPHATLAALAGFDHAVLIAGGRNKGLDLSELRRASARLRGVVAIGEAGAEISAAFAGDVPVVRAGSMDEAVAAAASLARTGDAVLLSPASASFDWYRSYGERGDDFVRAVNALVRWEGAP